MYTPIIKHLLISLYGVCLLACGDSSSLAPFSSDGCSLFPDGSILTKEDWCECCFQHDIAYWRGGTAQEREQADLNLRQCVLAKSGDETLARLMYEGVRFGGSPYFYSWYRWGYCWPYDRKYQALSEKESARADALLQDYFAHHKNTYCSS